MRPLLAAVVCLTLLAGCERGPGMPAGPAKPKTVYKFSEARLVIVNGRESETALSLDSGMTVKLPPRLAGAPRQAFLDQKKIDAWVFPNDQDFLLTIPGKEQVVISIQPADAWDKLTPEQVLGIIKENSLSNPPPGATSSRNEPVVAVFRSARGVVGIVRLTGKSDAKGGNRVEIQEKLVLTQTPATQGT
jgi:hypothetical protein